MMQKRIKKILSGIICITLISSFLKLPVSASSVADSIHSDTTNDMNRSVGERYCFRVTPQDKGAKVSYTVGNGDVLHTFIAGKPVKNADGTTTYYFGFKCCKEGVTAIYMNIAGKLSRLFSVSVRTTTTFAQALGMRASWYSKIIIQHTNIKKAVTDQSKIQSLLNDLAVNRLIRQPAGTPQTFGWEYALYFYPADGSGAYEYVDTSGFSKDAGCTVKGPTGYYIPENWDSVHKILSAFYNQNR